MTGFARRERQGPWGTLACEIRSVNHRYLELSLRLPEDLRSLEGDARQAVSAALRRGKVDVAVYLRGQPAQAGMLEINRVLVEQLARTARDVAGMTDSSLAAVSPLDLLRWPGVIREPEKDLQPVQAVALELLHETVRELNESRAREGGRLREMLFGRCQSLAQTVAQLRERLPEIAARIRERVGERVAQLGGPVDPARLEQELVLLAYKMDFAEELDRLGSHVTETLQILDAREPAGRRLDFLMQEFNREANTLSSKSQDADTTRAAVDMKVLIEQMREQVQNIE
ncbi:MAG: YicC family protein [Gammaproteobacteria bacterium]|nr:YicC family protein [Gammaproteobacteria bacterium]MDH4311637.1 YicC family protein [Gammaproteobacteria bacterium]MDH5273848.1 YicC family protein [Gammaproteobacteria bacterium]